MMMAGSFAFIPNLISQLVAILTSWTELDGRTSSKPLGSSVDLNRSLMISEIWQVRTTEVPSFLPGHVPPSFREIDVHDEHLS
jgi:hypothetical protein